MIARLQGARSLEDAATRYVEEIYTRYKPSVVLARVYATVPFRELPADDQAFVRRTFKNVAITPETVSLSLLGTRGVKPAWNARRESRGHLAIPLVDAAFIEGIPMIARLLAELGVDTRLFESSEQVMARKLIGGFNGVFYVADAGVALDSKGRKIIPAVDFVKENGVKTVFGMGGIYMHGTMVVGIVFTRESLQKTVAETFATTVSQLKIATERLVTERKIYG